MNHFQPANKARKVAGESGWEPGGWVPTVPSWTASGSAFPGCPCVLGAEAGGAAWVALPVGWRFRAPQRGRWANPDGVRGSTEPALPGRNFSSRPWLSFLLLGVRPGGGVRLGGGPSHPPRPPGRPPASWDRSVRPPQAPRAPLETERLEKAMNSGEIRHYAHANTRARTQLRCGLGVPPPSCTQSFSGASETVLPLIGKAALKHRQIKLVTIKRKSRSRQCTERAIPRSRVSPCDLSRNSPAPALMGAAAAAAGLNASKTNRCPANGVIRSISESLPESPAPSPLCSSHRGQRRPEPHARHGLDPGGRRVPARARPRAQALPP